MLVKSFPSSELKLDNNDITNYRAGFTLIELLMVILIIAIVVSGILITKALLRSSEINSIIVQKDIFNNAVTAFRDKYNCLPADCKNGDDLGFIQDSNNYTKGDGIVDDDEKLFFWDLLSKNKFIGEIWNSIYLPKIATNSVGNRGYWDLWSPKDPKITASGDGTFTHLTGNNYYWLHGEVEMFSFPYKSAGIFIPVDAYDIDIKIDDGIPLTGDVQAAGDSYGYKLGNADYPGNGPWKPDSAIRDISYDGCLIGYKNLNTIEEYNITNEKRIGGNLCSLLIKSGF